MTPHAVTVGRVLVDVVIVGAWALSVGQHLAIKKRPRLTTWFWYASNVCVLVNLRVNSWWPAIVAMGCVVASLVAFAVQYRREMRADEKAAYERFAKAMYQAAYETAIDGYKRGYHMGRRDERAGRPIPPSLREGVGGDSTSNRWVQ